VAAQPLLLLLPGAVPQTLDHLLLLETLQAIDLAGLTTALGAPEDHAPLAAAVPLH
jgi:hypothetical protein